MTKADRDYFLSVGICPTCKKNKIYSNEKECEACSQWRYMYNRRARTFYKREYNDYQRQYQIKRRERLKSQGLCTRCGKRKAVTGRVNCEICLAKHREERRLEYYEKKKLEAERETK